MSERTTPRNDEPQRILQVPHFVGIGAPRCGTTWAFKMLRMHPDAWIPWKEVHYFDSVDPETDSGYHIQSRWFRVRTGWLYLARRLAASSLPGASALAKRFAPLRSVHAPGFRWAARYAFGRVSLEWYESLFQEGQAAGFRCGEITPAYCMLSEQAIGGFARALPQARAFLLLRNPLEWAWSGLCKDVRESGRRPEDLSLQELIEWCPVPTGRSRQDFGSNLRRWFQNFPRERLLVCFHEEIRTQPAALLDRLCAFVGLRAFDPERRALATSRVNSSARGTQMPAGLARYVAERYRHEAEIVAELVGGPAEKWVDEMNEVLRR